MNNFNFSRSDILNDKQKDIKKKIYNLNEMSACMDIGTLRKTQEDSVLLLEHPEKKEFKLIAIADGMGGLSNGSKASNLALLNIINWFENIPSNYYFKENQILIELYEELDYIDLLIRKYCENGGTTLSLSILTSMNGICVNIGDSRIYIHKNGKLKQVSKDHSISWELYEKRIISEKDDIRFHKENNLITSRLGCEKKKLKIDREIITKNDYESIYLFTDGVTDCLTDYQIEQIINCSRYNNKVHSIVEAALVTTSTNNNLNLEEYYSTINGGKDNSSAVAYIKKLK